MGILSRRRRPPAVARDEHGALSFAAELPVGQREPLWRIRLQYVTQPQGDGERMVMRAHIQTNFASALRPALQDKPRHEHAALAHDGRRSGTSLRLRERAGGAAQELARRVLQAPLVRRLAEPLLQLDLNTWVEVQASTASLHAGSHELLPQAERLARLGIRPQTAGAEPLAETWSGDAGDGFAQVSVLQIDKRHLPPRLRRLLGEQPFGLAATIVNSAEQKPPPES